MSRKSWKTHRYDELPYEILCLIFDRLDLSSLKCASLTCHRWCEIIFSGRYIKRFTLYVPLVRWPVHVKDGLSSPFRRHGEDAGDSKRLILLKAVKRSNRVYRNLTLELEDRSDCNRSATGTLYALLQPHRLEQLVSLRIVLKQEASQLLEMVVKTIPKMSQLHDLLLNGCCSSSTLHRLHSDSVRRLELDTIVPQQLEMPRYLQLGFTCNVLAVIIALSEVNSVLLKLLQLAPVEEFAIPYCSGDAR
uniref:F-box domain-containing protein n=1 Tax=Anopheles albimanus TaxID=7167 RepID=A0A182FYE9_ANOAL